MKPIRLASSPQSDSWTRRIHTLRPLCCPRPLKSIPLLDRRCNCHSVRTLWPHWTPRSAPTTSHVEKRSSLHCGCQLMGAHLEKRVPRTRLPLFVALRYSGLRSSPYPSAVGTWVHSFLGQDGWMLEILQANLELLQSRSYSCALLPNQWPLICLALQPSAHFGAPVRLSCEPECEGVFFIDCVGAGL